MMTVKDLNSLIREELIVGLDAIRFTDSISLADQLDHIKIEKIKHLVDFANDLTSRGIKNVPSICVKSEIERVKEEIKKAYRQAGLTI
jgi:hypothetical protein